MRETFLRPMHIVRVEPCRVNWLLYHRNHLRDWEHLCLRTLYYMPVDGFISRLIIFVDVHAVTLSDVFLTPQYATVADAPGQHRNPRLSAYSIC
jgi:hypothetical protein